MNLFRIAFERGAVLIQYAHFVLERIDGAPDVPAVSVLSGNFQSDFFAAATNEQG